MALLRSSTIQIPPEVERPLVLNALEEHIYFIIFSPYVYTIHVYTHRGYHFLVLLLLKTQYVS